MRSIIFGLSSIHGVRRAARGCGLALVAAVGLLSLVAAAAPNDASGATASGIQVGEELVLAGNGAGKPDRGGQSLAFGKDSCLVVWREGMVAEGETSQILVRRVSPDGKILDAQPIPLTSGAKLAQDRPRVAFCPSTGSGPAGGVYLVVWQDFGNGTDMDVHGARVGLDGKVLDAKPMAIAVGPHTQVLPEIASDGKTGWLVVWQGFVEKENGYRTFAAKIGADGAVGKPVSMTVGPTPKVAWDGKGYLVGGFSGGYGLRTCRLTAEGTLDGAAKENAVKVGGQHLYSFSLSAMPGKGWVMVADRSIPDNWGWAGPGAMRCVGLLEDGQQDKAQQLEGQGPAHNVLQPNWLDTDSGKAAGDYWPWGRSSVAWGGQECVAAWTRCHFAKQGAGGYVVESMEPGDIVCGRIASDWSLPDAKRPVLVSANNSQNPAVASDGNGKLLCVYEKKTAEGNTQICAKPITTRAAK